MASEDVIELGSSDEESEPAPKKANMAKRRPNAMVQIPPGLTIKPTKPANHNINPINKLMGKGLTVTKVGSNPKSSNIRNGKPTRLPQIQPNNMKVLGSSVIPVQRLPVSARSTALVNPMNMMKQINNSVIVSRPPNPMAVNFPARVQNAKAINILPSSITVTKKTGVNVGVARIAGMKPTGIRFAGALITGAKRPAATSTQNAKKKRKLDAKQQVQTVDLDDEEVPTTSTASPQWYLRPEDTKVSDVIEKQDGEEQSMEKQNNAEPDKFVEITIEDSPIKPAQNKRTHEVGVELAITIDDSPVKAAAAKDTISADSDNEKAEQTPKDKHSKKKLEYPKDVESQDNVQTCTVIEIELEPLDTKTDIENADNSSNEKTNKKSDEEVIISEEPVKENENIATNDMIIEVFESPAKPVQKPASSTPKKDPPQRKVKPITITPEASQPSEFHPAYQEFIDLCLKLENSNDMKTIVEKKIKSYYRQVPKEYTESEEFVELVQSKIFAMRAGPEKLYLYIKDIVDELNLQRKMAKSKPIIKETSTIEAEKFQYGEESEFDSKRQRQIRKLEKTLKKLHRAIQKLEEQEVDFDDEEDSVYLLTESDDSSSSIKDLDRQLERERSVLLKRYKERMVRVHAKFCQLTNTKMPSEPRIQIQQRPGQPAGPAKRLEKWINKKVPIGKPLPFPDFHDVLRCVREANDEDKLGWNEAEIMDEARDLFTRCGKKLQRRRQENEWRLAASRIASEVDPAEKSEELKKKLDTNKQVAAKKETEVFNKYADKQSQLKLEAVEIGDKEAEESPVESEDEEPQEESSTLENKEKRKERLRRLLSEKSKKTESKEKEPKEASPNEEKDVSEENKNDTEKVENEKMEVDIVPEDANKDNMELFSVLQSNKEEIAISKERIHSISGESKVDSDIDELHLLQKLHSDEVNTSAATDSDSPIDISDTLTSSDNKKPSNSDVISIENSSYSESEVKDDVLLTSVDGKRVNSENELVEELVEGTEKADIVSATSPIHKTNNEEYNESVESILLATTDEEADDKEKDESPRSNDECVNLKDDAISIGETVIEKADDHETETKQGASCLPQNENTEVSGENSQENVVPESNCRSNEDSEETSARSVETITEEDNEFTGEVETNLEKEANAANEDMIEEIHSVESVVSDNVQDISKGRKEVSKADQQQSVSSGDDDAAVGSETVAIKNVQQTEIIQKLTVETIESDSSQEKEGVNEFTMVVEPLESDNSQAEEAAIVNGDVVLEDVQQSKIMINPAVETLESDNSQETAKETEDIEMINELKAERLENPFEILEADSQEAAKDSEGSLQNIEQKSDSIGIPSVETLESDNSQETSNDKENGDHNSQIADNSSAVKESLEIHELTDSNSPNQDASTENETNKHINSDGGDNENNLESVIAGFRSDKALSEKLATTTAVTE